MGSDSRLAGLDSGWLLGWVGAAGSGRGLLSWFGVEAGTPPECADDSKTGTHALSGGAAMPSSMRHEGVVEKTVNVLVEVSFAGLSGQNWRATCADVDGIHLSPPSRLTTG
jgi:hypothetical protein